VNYGRIVVSALAAFVVFFVYGFLVHGMLIARDYLPYPIGVYRTDQSLMPVGMVGIFVAILVFAIIYARSCSAKAGPGAGAQLGFLFGLFMAGAFVAVNYATIKISGRLALELALSEFIEWTLVGLVVGSLYKPPAKLNL